jgi:SAM-dependent methyltransferase
MTNPTPQHICPLCLSPEGNLFSTAEPGTLSQSKPTAQRQFFRCHQCDLIFADPESHMSHEAEKDRYSHHENNLSEPHYRAYLQKMWEPLQKDLSDFQRPILGLDFGCGPTQAFSELAQESGIKVLNYDPYFQNEPALFDYQYDFIWSSEVFEHLNFPHRELMRLTRALKPGGLLAIGTQLHSVETPVTPKKFSNWFYQRDPTHVSFYSSRTLDWISQTWGIRCKHYDK